MTVKPTISKYLNKVLILHKYWDGIHMQASLKIPKDTCFSLFVWLVLVFLRHRVFDSEKASSSKEPTFAEKTGCIQKAIWVTGQGHNWSGQCNDVFSLLLARLQMGSSTSHFM